MRSHIPAVISGGVSINVGCRHSSGGIGAVTLAADPKLDSGRVLALRANDKCSDLGFVRVAHNSGRVQNGPNAKLSEGAP